MKRRSTTRAVFALLLVGLMALGGGLAAAASTVVVMPSDVGVNWSTADTRTGGSASFVIGPTGAPLGVGSLQIMSTDAYGSSQAKAQLFNYGYFGTPLADFGAISYSVYRSSNSTNSAAQTISLNFEVDFNGALEGGFTTLVFEPIYQAGGVGAMRVDTWQTWDAYAGGAATWWSTKDIPGVCAFSCFVSWNDILESNPDAVIGGGIGFNVGSGWAGEFSGNTDALTINGTVYDFEPQIGPPTSKDECKDGGWQTFNTPHAFANQGECVSYVASGS